MKEYLISAVKKVTFAFCVIYALNLVIIGLNIFIPINFITISVVSILGISGLLSLVAIYLVLL